MRIHLTSTSYNAYAHDIYGKVGIGLFSSSQGTIKNVHLMGVDITSILYNDMDEIYVGSIVGYTFDSTYTLRPTITNCSSDGTIKINRTYAKVGGIVGYSVNTTINKCNSGSVLTSTGETGGIVGFARYNTLITNCINLGWIDYNVTLIHHGYNNAGGIAGKAIENTSLINNETYGHLEYAGSTSNPNLKPAMGIFAGYIDTKTTYSSNMDRLSTFSFGNLASFQRTYFGTGILVYPNHFGYIKDITKDYNTTLITPVSYNLPSEYFLTSDSKYITSTSGEDILVSYQRTGYIKYHGNYLSMSAKTRNAGVAFMHYTTPFYTSSITYNLSLWSDSENIILNSSINLEYIDSTGNWVIAKTFDPKNMSKDKDTLLEYTTNFPSGVTNFRFIIKTDVSNINNDNNLGRVVLGNLYLTYEI
jgi:hypothetical protein